MIEEWKYVVGCEGFYKISNKGRVKSLSRIVKSKKQRLINENILKQNISKNGYFRVKLRSKINKLALVHRLVAMAFIPNQENKPQVNHIDGNKTNNNVNNLEWVTPSENIKHSYKIGLHSQVRGRNAAAVKVIDISNGIIIGCVTDAAIYAGLKRKTLSAMLSGQYKNKTTLKYL